MEKERKKKIITLLVIVFVTTLSIAFAAVSRTLNINGTAKMDTASWDIHFDNLSKANLINTAEEINEPNYADNKGTIENINVKLKNPKDEVIYTVDIVNDGTMDAEVTVTSLTELTEEESKLFDFGVYYSDGTKITKYDLLEAGKSKEVTIKLRYKDDITEADLPEVPLTISFGFTLNYIQSDASMVVTPNGDLENVVSTLARGANTESTSTFFNGSITKESVESITFLSTLKVPKEVQSTAWDASEKKDGSVIAWYTDLDENNLYELNIGGNGKVYAPSNSSYLFNKFRNVKEINFNNNFDTSNVTTMYFLLHSCSSTVSIDLSSFDTSKVTTMQGMFSKCSSLTSLDLSNFNTENVTNMTEIFYMCSKLTNLNTTSFNTSKVTNFFRMYAGCTNLKTLDVSNLNTSSATKMNAMFFECESLEYLDLSNFSSPNVQDLNSMFQGCKSLKTIIFGSFNTYNATDMHNMFTDCKSLVSLDLTGLDTSNVTNMGNMFYGIKINTLDLSSFDTGKVTNFAWMFRTAQIGNLNITGWNTSSAIDMNYMFMSANIPKLDLSSFDTSKVKNVRCMFSQMFNVTEIKFNKLDTTSVTDYWQIFGACGVKTLDISEVEASMYSNEAFKGILSNLGAGKTIYVLNEECVTLGQAINPNVNFVVKEA